VSLLSRTANAASQHFIFGKILLTQGFSEANIYTRKKWEDYNVY